MFQVVESKRLTSRYRQRWRGGRVAPWFPRRVVGQQRPSYRLVDRRGQQRPFLACRLGVSGVLHGKTLVGWMVRSYPQIRSSPSAFSAIHSSSLLAEYAPVLYLPSPHHIPRRLCPSTQNFDILFLSFSIPVQHTSSS